jgi:Holliday junction resolvase-like predicted endonuclease
MGIRENKVEKYLNDQIKELGGITRKWVSPGRAGVPDRIVIVKGVVAFVEVKTMDGKVSTVQQREMERLEQAGASVFIAFGKPGVDKFISIMRGVLDNVSNNDSTDRERVLR